MTLPPTYYDFIRKLRPFVLDLAELDAQDLLSSPGHPKSIHSVDDYSSRFKECLDLLESKAMEYISERMNINIEDVKPFLADAPPSVKTYLTSMFHTVNHEYHCLVNFALAGKKTFHFSDNLSEHLANTEINLRTGLVELPFTSCMFTFTSSVVVNAMHNIRGASGRRDMNTDSLDYSAPITVFLTMHPKDIVLPGRKLVIVAWHARPPDNCYLMLKRELYMDETWTLEQALRTDWEKLDPENCGAGLNVSLAEENIEPQGDNTFYTDGLTFYRIILNAILYLSSDHPELFAVQSPRSELESRAKSIQSAPKRKKTMRAANQHSILDYQEVGSSVGSIIVQRGAGSSKDSIIPEDIGNKPLVRFTVRGHWRHQPFGTGNLERKLIWIRPFYKGYDLAAHINKPYLVK